MIIKQVWKCPKCSNEYRSPIATVEVTCNSKHSGTRMVLVAETNQEEPPTGKPRISIKELVQKGKK